MFALSVPFAIRKCVQLSYKFWLCLNTYDRKIACDLRENKNIMATIIIKSQAN